MKKNPNYSKRAKIGDRVEIIWIDAAHQSGWQKRGDAGSSSEEELWCKSTGYVYEFSNYSIKLCTSFSLVNDVKLSDAGSVTEIPFVMIKKFTKFPNRKKK